MPNYRLTPDAQLDLIDIRRFTVTHWGKTQSQKYLSELQQTIRLLAETPSLGKPRPDIGASVQSFPCASHVIYYISHNNPLIVFGVLHKRKVPQNHLDGRDVV